MLKPSSSNCNLSCEYCFYNSLASQRQSFSKGYMTKETSHNIILSALDYAKNTEVYFVFQGGEPSLAGISFYKDFVDFVSKNNSKGATVNYCFQTNGTLINDEWCEFFKQNGFLVGVSLDGNKEQNKYRIYPNKKDSFDDVMNGINLLKKHGVEFNVLAVLTKFTANTVRDSYRFFKQNSLNYFQYIAGLSPFGYERQEDDIFMSVSDYSYFLEKAFRLYYNDITRGNKVSIRQFDNYSLLASGRHAEQCGMNGFCSRQFVVEGDGSVYPCDFFCTDEWLLGNINEPSFSELEKTEKAQNFVKESFVFPEKCKKCAYFGICRACGCKRTAKDIDYCDAYKKFFSENLEKIKMLNRGNI